MTSTTCSQLPKWSGTNYFLIDNKFYDLTDFIDRHPGGRKMLLYSKELTYDATVHFSMHHVNYEQAYSMLTKYEIKDPNLIAKCYEMIENEKYTNQYFKKQIESKLTAPKQRNKQTNSNSLENRKQTTDDSHSDSEHSFESNISNPHATGGNVSITPNMHKTDSSEDSIFSESDDGSESGASSSNGGTGGAATTTTSNGIETSPQKAALGEFANLQGAQQFLQPKNNFKTKNTIVANKTQTTQTNNNTKETINYTKKDFNDEFLKCQRCCFELPKKGSFYYELRAEAWKYFRSTRRKTGPMSHALIYWWSLIAIYVLLLSFNIYSVGRYLKSSNLESLPGLDWNSFGMYLKMIFIGILQGILLAWLGGFGHQWVHMAAYRKHGYVLDWIGLYSHSFRREHLFWHHAYTNTIADNHFDGTDPFIYVNPLKPRYWVQKYCTVTLVNFVLAVGVFGNYIYNWVMIFQGLQRARWFVWVFPGKCVLYCYLCSSVTAGMFCLFVCLFLFFFQMVDFCSC